MTDSYTSLTSHPFLLYSFVLLPLMSHVFVSGGKNVLRQENTIIIVVTTTIIITHEQGQRRFKTQGRIRTCITEREGLDIDMTGAKKKKRIKAGVHVVLLISLPLRVYIYV